MRDDYLAPFWADHHGLWADFVGDAIRRVAALPAAIGRRTHRRGPERRRPTHKEA